MGIRKRCVAVSLQVLLLPGALLPAAATPDLVAQAPLLKPLIPEPMPLSSGTSTASQPGRLSAGNQQEPQTGNQPTAVRQTGNSPVRTTPVSNPANKTSAAASPVPRDMETLNAEIVAKELELIKLNTRLRIQMLPHSPWTQRRWFTYSLGNYVLTSVGAYMNGCGKFSYLKEDRIRRAPPYLYIDAGWLRVFANILSVAGASAEFTLDRWTDFSDHRHAIDLRTMRRYADMIQNEMDALIAERERAVAATTATGLQLEELKEEGAVLRDLREAAVTDFARFYAEAKGHRVSRDIQLLVTWASNFNSGAGSMVGIRMGLRKKGRPRYKNRLTGTGGVCDIISGALNFSTPAMQQIGAAIARKVARHSICAQLDCQRQLNLKALSLDEEKFKNLVRNHPELKVKGVILKTALMQRESQILSTHESMRIADRTNGRVHFIDQMIPATLTAPAKITNGISTSIGSFKYSQRAEPRFRVEAVGGIVYGTGYAAASVEILRQQAHLEWKNYQQRKHGGGPKAVLTKQLQELEELSGQAAKLRTASSTDQSAN